MSSSNEPYNGVDLDAGSGAPLAKKHRSLKSTRSRDWHSVGPGTLADVMNSNKQNVSAMLVASCCGHPNLTTNLCDAVIINKVFTSTYTGSNCFDASARESLHWMAELTQATPGEVLSYAASEIQDFARNALMTGPHAPLHAFENVLGRLPLEVRKKL